MRRFGAIPLSMVLCAGIAAALPSRAIARPLAQPPGPTASASATASATDTVYLPNITRMLGGPDGWQTPFIVQNVGAIPTDLTLAFYALADGRLVKTRTVQGLAPGRSVFHDPNADAELPAGGQFSVVVTSTVARIVAVVNEHQHVRDPARQEALSYVGLSSGSTVVSLPYVVKQLNGWLTTMIIQNVGTAPARVTASFVSSAGKVGLVRSIAPGRSSAIDPTVESALAAGTAYTVTLSADQPIAAVVNAHNDAAGVAHPMGFSYNGLPADSSTHVLVPYVADLPALAGRSSTLYIQNAGLSAAAPSLVFRRLDLTDTTQVDLPALAPGASTAFQPSQTKVGAGEFSVEITGGQFAVVAASTTAVSAMGYSGTAEPSERIYLPNVTRTLGGPFGWTTPIVVQTASAYQPTITLRWYGFADGALVFTQTITDLGYGAAKRIDPRDSPALADNAQYAVVIDAPLGAAAVVTEQSGSGGDGEMSYEGLAAPAGVVASPCVPFSGPAGTSFTCSFAGLPAGSPATVAVSSAYGEGFATAAGAVAADGTLTVRRTVQTVGRRTLTVRAGGDTRTAEVDVVPGNFAVAITTFTKASLSVHTEPGLVCLPRLTFSDGSVRTGGDLSLEMTNLSGDATWNYAALSTPPGPATADVSCAWSDLVIADERSLVIGKGLYGRVSDRGGAPVQGASMHFFQGFNSIGTLPPVTTDAFGNYAISIPPAAYRVQAVPPLASGLSSGFAKDAVAIFDAAEFTVSDAALAADVTLRAGYVVSGRVVDQKSAPVRDMNVYVTAGGTYVLSVVTDADGAFALRLPTGSYALRVYPMGPGPCCSGQALVVTSVDVSQDTRLPALQLPP